MPPTHYPPELIEAAEKEYPYLYDVSDKDHISQTSNAIIDGQRSAYLKGLSLAMPLVEALEEISIEKYPESIFRPISDEQFESIKQHLRENGYSIDALSGYYGRIFHKMHRDIAAKALANFPQK